MAPLIAIDGPSGSGKSSTSRGVASALGLRYLDTGSMYRAIAWLYLQSGLPADDADAIAELARAARLDVDTDPSHPAIAVNGTDVTDAIRDPSISACVSTVATNLDVRAWLTAQMRAIIAEHARQIVVEGRDITTVVAPDAEVRVLLVADPAARIARRQAELGTSASADQVTDQIVRRDRDDSTVSEFHRPSDGVTVVDSTHLGLDEVVARIVELASSVG